MIITIPNRISKSATRRHFGEHLTAVAIGAGDYIAHLSDSTPIMLTVRFAASNGLQTKYRSSSHLVLVELVRKAVTNEIKRKAESQPDLKDVFGDFFDDDDTAEWKEMTR